MRDRRASGSGPSEAGAGSDKKRMRRGGRLEREPDGREAARRRPDQEREGTQPEREGEGRWRREGSLAARVRRREATAK